MRSEESGMPGSAGTFRMTVLVSTAMTPTGVPPSRARPVITVLAQPACSKSSTEADVIFRMEGPAASALVSSEKSLDWAHMWIRMFSVMVWTRSLIKVSGTAEGRRYNHCALSAALRDTALLLVSAKPKPA